MKLALSLALVILSAILLGAHFLRSAQYVAVAVCLAAPAVLLARRAWAVRAIQAGLMASAGVWISTAAGTASDRLQSGQPWIRMAVILGSVALLAVAGAVMLQIHSVRSRLAREFKDSRSGG